jgi:hypothetical protein
MTLACTKEPVQVYQGSPVFKIKGTIGGESINIDAGVNGYMESYHDTLFNKSYVGCSFVSETSASPIHFDLALDGLLNDVLFSGGFNNIELGSLSKVYPLLMSEVSYYDIITSGEWIVNGTSYANDAFIESNGVYDIEFRFLSYGEEYILRDKLYVGGEEHFEPEIEIIEGDQGLFTFMANNVPSHVDSVEWILDSGFETFVSFSPQAEFQLSPERFVIQCNYYSNGSIVNYRSQMFGYESTFGNISIDNILNSITELSNIEGAKGQMIIEKNDVQYVSLDNMPSVFEISNFETFTDPSTSMELLKGDFVLGMVLFASPSDSLVIDLQGTMGLKLNP